MMDTVFDGNMAVVFNDEPEVVARRLRAPYPDYWWKVCIGETREMVTISKYLYQEKYDDILAMLKELLRKQDAALYKRHPERLEIYLEAAAKRIIDRVLGD